LAIFETIQSSRYQRAMVPRAIGMSGWFGAPGVGYRDYETLGPTGFLTAGATLAQLLVPLGQ
jgi:hypothetical protein